MKKKGLQKVIYSILILFLVIPQFLTPYATIVFSDDTKESSKIITNSELDSSSLLDLEQAASPAVENVTSETEIDDTTTSISETLEIPKTDSSASEKSSTAESNHDLDLMKSDNTPPVLESVEISSKEVNVGDKVTFKAKVSDDLSGVTYVSVDFNSPTESRRNAIVLRFNELSGLWEGSYTVQEHDEAGEWSLYYLAVHDKIGNVKLYRQVEIETNLTYTVTNLSSDKTPPVLESVEISSKEVNVGDTVTIKAKVSDDLSGVTYVNLEFNSPTESRRNKINLRFNVSSGLWEGSYTVQEHDEAGKWSLYYLAVHDKIGNIKLYKQTEIETNMSYEVNNPSSDNTPPILESVEISSKEVNVGDTVTIKAKVSDDLSGVTYVNLEFNSPTESRRNKINLRFNVLSGLWEGSYTVQEHDEVGEWLLNYLAVHDKIGNIKLYRQTEIEIDLSYFIKSLNEDGSENELLPCEIVTSNTTWSNKTINKDVYVGPNAVLDITGNVQINGNVYVYGIIRAYRGLKISGKLSAKQVIYSSSIGGSLYQGGVYLALGGGHSIPSTEVSNNAYPIPLEVNFKILESKDKFVVSGETLPFLDVYIDEQKVAVNQRGHFTIELAISKNTVPIRVSDIFGHVTNETIKLGLYILTFETNGGGKIAQQEFNNINLYPKKPSNPIKNGYTFEGWYFDQKFLNPVDFSSTTGLNESTIVYAKWKKIITNLNQYGTILEQKYHLFEDEALKKDISSKYQLMNKTVHVTQSFISEEGETIYLISDSKQQLGYIKSYDIQLAIGEQGVYHNYGKYVMLKGDYAIWNGFDWATSTSAAPYKNKTVQARGIYYHFNGSSYLSLYDNQGKWIGYMNAAGAHVAPGQQGIYQTYNKYVMLKGDYPIWTAFDWAKSIDLTPFKNKTLEARGIYYHFNGSSYLSLYDNQGKWIGYMNAAGANVAPGQQGIYQAYNKYVMLKGDYAIWNGFDWTKSTSAAPYKNKTVQARGIYYHFNGSSYLSLYDNQGKWIGYTNAAGANVSTGQQGIYQTYNKYVMLKGDYPIWTAFDFAKSIDLTSYKNKTVQARGIYYHFNGSSYLSLYDNQGKWIGYTNAAGAHVAPGQQGIYQTYNKYVTVKSNSYAIWKNFGWSSKASGKFAGKTYLAKGIYRHFNGSSYLSLYDSNNKWIGYINQNGTKAGSSQQEKFKKVQDLLNKEFKNQNLGIYVMSLVDGSTAQINGNKQFHAASTGKLPALYYTQKMILEKRVDGNKLLTYTDAINQMPGAYMRGGAGVLQSQPYGKKFSLNTIMNWTAKYSDNQGTNFLAYYASNKYDAAMKKEISTIMGRNWTAPFYVNAKDNAMMLEAIYNQGGKLITDMSNTVYDNQRIPKYIPVQVAHKIGDVNDLRHDAGIIYSKDPYVLSVLTQNYQSYEKISVLSKKIYDILK